MDDDLVEDLTPLITKLRELSQTPALSSLHEIEQMIVSDVLQEHRHLKCPGCKLMIEKLIEKMTVVKNSQ